MMNAIVEISVHTAQDIQQDERDGGKERYARLMTRASFEEQKVGGSPFDLLGDHVNPVNRDNLVFLKDVAGHAEEYLRHIAMLIDAASFKDLRVDNLTSYFQSQGSNMNGTSALCALCNYWGKASKRFFQDDAHKEARANMTWYQYRTNTFSTATLCLKLATAHPAIYAAKFRKTVSKLKEIQLNADKPTVASQIDDAEVVATYAYLSVTNDLPDQWYSGKRIWDGASGADKEMWIALFSAYLRKMKGTSISDELSLAANMVRVNAVDLADLRGVDFHLEDDDLKTQAEKDKENPEDSLAHRQLKASIEMMKSLNA
jgi:hypothetical protein